MLSVLRHGRTVFNHGKNTLRQSDKVQALLDKVELLSGFRHGNTLGGKGRNALSMKTWSNQSQTS